MKTALTAALLLLAACLLSEAVQVKEGDFTFSLESVMKLGDLMDRNTPEKQSPRLADTSSTAVCGNPALPQEFVPVCQSKGAVLSFSRLAYIALHHDECEICMNAACTGC
ncbi:guanylate cyclase activator 2B-like [Megalops cyprinoides]|uniref:guanylate cyclase activator 2B-like n=1 Tax=Megalops cyprinoides TaxID=118141 RepID=UPI001863F6FA|nr:guanylate cyclase activator 2B-like [Megalops cyprinoides]